MLKSQSLLFRVQFQTGVLLLLFSDSTYLVSSSKFEEQMLSICIWVMSSRPEQTANAQWELLKPNLNGGSADTRPILLFTDQDGHSRVD